MHMSTHELMTDNIYGLILHANYTAQTLHANNEQLHIPLVFIIQILLHI